MSVKAASMHYEIPCTTLISHLKNNVSFPGKNKLGDALSSVTNNITEKPQQADGAERSVAIIEIAPHQSNEQNVDQPCQSRKTLNANGQPEISFQELIPVPIAKLTKRKKKAARSELITSSPFKQSLVKKNKVKKKFTPYKRLQLTKKIKNAPLNLMVSSNIFVLYAQVNI